MDTIRTLSPAGIAVLITSERYMGSARFAATEPITVRISSKSAHLNKNNSLYIFFMPDLHFLSGHIMRGFMVLNTFFGGRQRRRDKKTAFTAKKHRLITD